MIKVGSVVLVNKNMSSDGKYDFTVGANIVNGGKYGFTEGKKGIVVSIDKSSTYPYQVRFGDAKSVRVRKQDLLLIK